MNVAKHVGLGQVEFGVEVACAGEHGTHRVFACHLVKVAGDVVGVELRAHDVLAVLDEHGQAQEEQERIVELGQRVDELFFATLGIRAGFLFLLLLLMLMSIGCARGYRRGDYVYDRNLFGHDRRSTRTTTYRRGRRRTYLS